MKICGIVVNGMPLIIPDNSSSTGYFKAFMNYCIQNFPVTHLDSVVLNKYFKLDQNHPDFKQGIFYNRIVEYNGVFYSTYSNNQRKKLIMEAIAEDLGLNLRIITRNNQ
jgi:hypothetical protein